MRNDEAPSRQTTVGYIKAILRLYTVDVYANPVLDKVSRVYTGL